VGTIACKGVCHHHKSTALGKAILKYLDGNVRCQVCDIFLNRSGTVQKPTGTFCICCGNRVRTKPRSNKCKQKYAERIEPMVA
jgi:hypothetical protein